MIDTRKRIRPPVARIDKIVGHCGARVRIRRPECIGAEG
jgi:hypothetical protein